MDLTNRELIVLLVLIIAIGVFLSFLFKTAVKIILTVTLIAVVWTVGFQWLPEQMDKIQNNDTTPQEIYNDIKDRYDNSTIPEYVQNTINGTVDYIEQNKQPWIDAFVSLMQKLTGQTPDEPIPSPTINQINP